VLIDPEINSRGTCFGPTTPTRAGRLADASVDPTEARKDTGHAHAAGGTELGEGLRPRRATVPSPRDREVGDPHCSWPVPKCEPTDHRRALRVTMPPPYRRDKGQPEPALVSWRSGGCFAASRGQASRPQASPARPAGRASRGIPAEIAGAIARHPASTPNSLRHSAGGSRRILQLEDGSLPPPISTMIWRSMRRKALR
jgi:hypothetical protein